ncbi:Hypothetical protein I5071_1090 (plasmid) [Sandaracinus amylolyticus]|nr:Hypothetical protein I5071_1090 [Sandaracinus amylolyticus]
MPSRSTSHKNDARLRSASRMPIPNVIKSPTPLGCAERSLLQRIGARWRSMQSGGAPTRRMTCALHRRPPGASTRTTRTSTASSTPPSDYAREAGPIARAPRARSKGKSAVHDLRDARARRPELTVDDDGSRRSLAALVADARTERAPREDPSPFARTALHAIEEAGRRLLNRRDRGDAVLRRGVAVDGAHALDEERRHARRRQDVGARGGSSGEQGRSVRARLERARMVRAMVRAEHCGPPAVWMFAPNTRPHTGFARINGERRTG